MTTETETAASQKTKKAFTFPKVDLKKIWEQAKKVAGIPVRLWKQNQINTKLLYLVTKPNKIEELKKCLAEGADPNAGLKADNPAVLRAAKAKNYQAIELLIAAGADAAHRTYGGTDTLMTEAIKTVNEKLFDSLLKHNKSLNAVNYLGETPLLCALRNEKTWDMFCKLLEAGPDLNLYVGHTSSVVLHIAAQEGNLPAVQKLIEHGALIDARDGRGSTPLDYARRNGHTEVADYIQGVLDSKVAPWKKLNDNEIAGVSIYRAIGTRITEIFNFKTERCITVTHNLSTGAESTFVANFDDIKNKSRLEEARAKLKV